MARPPKPWYWEARDAWVVTIGGRRHTLAKGRGGKAAATKAFHALMAAAEPTKVTTAPRSLLDVIDLYMDDIDAKVARGERSPKTSRVYAISLRSFLESVGKITVDELRPHHVTRWLADKTWGPTWTSSCVSVVCSALNWAKKQGYIPANPIADVPRPRQLSREIIPTHEQVDAMLAASEGRAIHDLILALRETGCRPNEVTGLTAAGVDLEAGTWTVKNKTRTSTGRPTRTVYLSSAMIQLSRRLVAEHPEGPIFLSQWRRPWTSRGVCASVERLRESLGFGPEVCAYGLRHLFVTDALERGVPPATVAELVGHTSLEMIMKVYSKIRQRTDHLREAVRTIRPDRGSGGSGPTGKDSASPPSAASDAVRPDARPGKRPGRTAKSG